MGLVLAHSAAPGELRPVCPPSVPFSCRPFETIHLKLGRSCVAASAAAAAGTPRSAYPRSVSPSNTPEGDAGLCASTSVCQTPVLSAPPSRSQEREMVGPFASLCGRVESVGQGQLPGGVLKGVCLEVSLPSPRPAAALTVLAHGCTAGIILNGSPSCHTC